MIETPFPTLGGKGSLRWYWDKFDCAMHKNKLQTDQTLDCKEEGVLVQIFKRSH